MHQESTQPDHHTQALWGSQPYSALSCVQTPDARVQKDAVFSFAAYLFHLHILVWTCYVVELRSVRAGAYYTCHP